MRVAFLILVLILSLACAWFERTLSPETQATGEEPQALRTEVPPPAAEPENAAQAEPPPAPAGEGAASAPIPAGLVQSQDFTYRGAFRLPQGDARPQTFLYGGGAMTFSPQRGEADAAGHLPGSLFISGHDRIPYGELPDGGQIAEVTIPEPVISKNPADLPVAEFLQDFHDVAQGYFPGLEEIPRLGLLYLAHPHSGGAIFLNWGQHVEPEPFQGTHVSFAPDLATAQVKGPWYIANLSPYDVNGYMLEIPAAWADAHVQGKRLGTGRYKDGGWSGMGPPLIAVDPWGNEDGAPPPAGARLAAATLLHYENAESTEAIERCLDGYQHPDEWEGGAWLESPSEKTALLFAGTKSNGAKYWYGYVHPAGEERVCVDADVVGQFTVCRLADGTPCPPEDLHGCSEHSEFRGWWSTRFDAQFLLYDPADLARVVSGEWEAWQPQPYATLDIDEHLLMNPGGVELQMIGSGNQRRYRIGETAYDREHNLLYVLELYADDARPVVHVWEIR